MTSPPNPPSVPPPANGQPAQNEPRNAEPRRDDSYFEKLVKYIPADILAAYMTFSGIITDQPNNPLWLYWVGFIGLLILAPLYTIYRPSEPPPLLYASKTKFCAVASAVSFAVWVFAIGGPFAATWPLWYRPIYGSLLLILTTLTLPIVEKLLLRTNSSNQQH